MYNSKSLFAKFYMNTTLHFTQQIFKLRNQSHHYPNTKSTGVCQYDITNATIDDNTVSMTTPVLSLRTTR